MNNCKVNPTYLKETCLSATLITRTAMKVKLCPPQREAGDCPPDLWLLTACLLNNMNRCSRRTAKCHAPTLVRNESKSLTRFLSQVLRSTSAIFRYTAPRHWAIMTDVSRQHDGLIFRYQTSNRENYKEISKSQAPITD